MPGGMSNVGVAAPGASTMPLSAVITTHVRPDVIDPLAFCSIGPKFAPFFPLFTVNVPVQCHTSAFVESGLVLTSTDGDRSPRAILRPR